MRVYDGSSFRAICEHHCTLAFFGKKQDLIKLEKELAHVAKNDCFENNDLLRIIKAEEWDYKKFWPEISGAVDDFTPIRGCFRLGWEGRKEVVELIFKKIKNIEVVSVLMRFIDPENYGIISPPVEKMLGIQPEDDHIKYYLSYLGMLKKFVYNYEKPAKIAHMDMAVWCLFFLIKNRSNRQFWSNWTPEDRRMKEQVYLAFMRDMYFKREKLVRALRQVYQCMEGGALNSRRLILAECLNDEGIDPELALVATSYTFESFAWSIISESPKFKDAIPLQRIRIRKILDVLEGSRIKKTMANFKECVDKRDRSIHPWLPRLSSEERRSYINKVSALLKMRSKGKL
jgi:hypothetical protein